MEILQSLEQKLVEKYGDAIKNEDGAQKTPAQWTVSPAKMAEYQGEHKDLMQQEVEIACKSSRNIN